MSTTTVTESENFKNHVEKKVLHKKKYKSHQETLVGDHRIISGI